MSDEIDIEKCQIAIDILSSDGSVIDERSEQTNTRGRPKKQYVVKGATGQEVVLSKDEYNHAVLVVKDKTRTLIPMTPEEYELLAREATPKLVKRMYDLALLSGNLKDVVAAARFMSEYGYGRPTQKVEITKKTDVVRKGWEDMPALEAGEYSVSYD